MADTVTKIRFWTIADFREEEIWLREMAQSGLHLKKMIVPCFYIFEKGAPRDVIYRLDFTNNDEGGDYKAMLLSLARLARLEGSYTVYPGHDRATDLERERRMNPYMRQGLTLA